MDKRDRKYLIVTGICQSLMLLFFIWMFEITWGGKSYLFFLYY